MSFKTKFRLSVLAVALFLTYGVTRVVQAHRACERTCAPSVVASSKAILFGEAVCLCRSQDGNTITFKAAPY